MHRVNEIVGKPIVSAETGDRLGSVSDALLKDGGVNVVALIIGGGLLAKEHVLPFRDIQTLGGDTVLARTDAGISSPQEWRRSGVKATRTSELRGKPVVTVGGQRLGEVSDLLVNDETGAFEGIEVAEPVSAGCARSGQFCTRRKRYASDLMPWSCPTTQSPTREALTTGQQLETTGRTWLSASR